MIALGYVRRSKKSEERTVSLQEQEQQIRQYCESQNFNLVNIIKHDGISGTERSRFNDIESNIKSYFPSCLVVYHLDRLARDVAGLVDYLRSLAKRGIKVFECGTGEIDLSKSSGFILTAVKGAFDELFPLIIGEKTADALRNKRNQGRRYTNIPPFGFVYLNNRLIEEPEEQRALVILEQCRQRGLGARRARRVLIEAGYCGRIGLTTLHKALSFAQNPSKKRSKLPSEGPR